MKKTVAIAVLCFLAVTTTAPQFVNSQDSMTVLKTFTRPGKIEGMTVSLTFLNDKTIDLIFSAPSKYAIRAKANQATAFYVQGVSEKSFTLNNIFTVEQDGQTYNCSAVNIENFAGGSVAKGARVKGILQLEKKLDLTHPFKIKNANNSIDLNFSDAVKQL